MLSFLGAIFAGAVPVPMYPQLSFKNVEGYHDTVAHIAQASGAKILLTTTTTQAVRRPRAARASRELESIVTVDELAGPAPGALDVTVRPRISRSFSSPRGARRARRA